MTRHQPRAITPEADPPRRTSRTRPPANRAAVLDQSPARRTFLRDVLEGLRRRPKILPCKYFYDERGSALFDRICTLPEYYLTRAETEIMRASGGEIAEAIGERALIIELGSGSSVKTRLLLDHLRDPAGYVPIDISREHLENAASALAARYPHVEVIPLCADYTAPFTVPKPSSVPACRVAYFPGSTIGNLHPPDAQRLLSRLASICRSSRDAESPGALLIGFDLRKDLATLEAAYNDAQGVTAEFNFNLLHRINRELDGDIDVSDFDFRAIWNEDAGRIESYLISRCDQTLNIGGEAIALQRGERIRTECSYKYTIEGFADLANPAGWQMNRYWTDEQWRFAVALLEC